MNTWNLGIRIFLFKVLAWLWGGCVGQTGQSSDQPLEPGSGASQDAANFIQEGNHFFVQKRFRDAEQKYDAAIQAQSSLGEAHYNLGLAFYKRRLYSQARPHFEAAAELEPYNPTIQNAPPFRKYGTVEPSTSAPAPDGHMGHQH